jgi:hypothetical protein
MAKSDANLLSQAEYARSRKDRGLPGGSRESVRKAVDEGRISAFGPDKLLDGALADTQWERNTRARVSPQALADVPASGSAADAKLSLAGVILPQPVAPVSTPANSGYSDARARREIADAEKAEIETAKMRGSMVMREDVDRAGYEVGREMRDALDSSVNSLAAELASLNTAEVCVLVIRRHNRAIQDLLSKSFREKIGAPLRDHNA